MIPIYRPKLKLPLSKFEIVIESICIMLLIVLLSGLVKIYPNLSEDVANHFNAKGNPDSYGGKNSVFIPAFIALGIYLLMTSMNRYPHLFNYPVKITEENARFQYQLAKKYIAILKLSTILIFVVIEWNSVHLAIDKSKAVFQGSSFLIFLSLVLVLPFVFYLLQAKQNK